MRHPLPPGRHACSLTRGWTRAAAAAAIASGAMPLWPGRTAAQKPTSRLTVSGGTVAPTTSVTGFIGDSIHGGPLAGAVVLLDGQSREAVTDSIGRFRLDSVTAGRVRLGIFHPILDSLGTSLASQPVRLAPGRPVLLSMATPSGRTIRRALCRDAARPTPPADSGVAVVVGRVLDPETEEPIPDAVVNLSWVETSFRGRDIRVAPYHRETTTDRSGEFRFCGLPAGLSGLLRAIRPAAVQGAGAQPNPTVVEREIELDNRIVTMATLHLPTATPTVGQGSRNGPVGHAVLDGDVRRPDGSPLVGATAFVEGTSDSAVTDRAGSFSMRRLPSGTHMVVVRSVGFEPVSAVVELTNREPQHVTIAMLTPAYVMSPVLVQVQQLQVGYARVGFDRREHAGIGQFMTADQIEAKHAQRFSELFANVGEVRLSYDEGGVDLVPTHGPGSCLVYVLDGQPFNRIIQGELDAMFQPEELAGIEIYGPAAVPVEFRVRSLPGPNAAGAETLGSTGCTTVVVWTKTGLGVREN